MEKALLTFIGNNDCLSDRPGAILTVLENQRFDKVFLLYNHDKYLEAATRIFKYCREKYPMTKVTYVETLISDPTDYNIVYPAMYSVVKKIVNDNKGLDFIISITSGTPTMHSCWLLLQQGGVIDANLIQVQKETGITLVDLNIDDFPQIKKIDRVKAELTKLSRENKILKSRLLEFDNIIGTSSEIQKVKEQIKSFASTDLSIFISGESGTGKELVAKSIHYNSTRKEKPLITVNCSAINPNLFESEFFGHKKGSFTGALTDKPGKFKLADEGTIFLDEVGDLPLEMQAKLLRVLENGKIQVVGGKEESVDVRVISATNKDIKKMVRDGDFRDDLFYRLVRGQIELPPLRQRGNDIVQIANFILDGLNKRNNENKVFNKSAVDLIKKYKWSGNIRQLKNAVESAFYLSGREITNDSINIVEFSNRRESIEIPKEGIDLHNNILPKYYRAALNMANGNKSEAAKLLGLEPHTFRARLEKAEIK